MYRSLFRSSFVIGLSLIAVASVHGRDWLVPVAAHVDGAEGSHWRTDLQIASVEAAEVIVSFQPSDPNADGSGFTTLSIPAGGHVEVIDIVGTTFEFEGTGFLIARSTTELIVNSRTYNFSRCYGDRDCRYGQSIRGVEARQWLIPGETGHLIELRADGRFRGNVGFTNPSGTDGSVEVRFIDGSGRQIGLVETAIEAFSNVQINNLFGGSLASGTALRGEVRATVPIVAYSSIVERNTGDPTTSLARHAIEAYGKIAVPVVAKIQGVGEAWWRSDLRIFNPGPGSATAVIDFVPRGDSSILVYESVTIEPGEMVSYEDVVTSLFGLETGVGTLWIDSSERVLAGSRSYTQLPWIMPTLVDSGETVKGSSGIFSFGQSVVALPRRESLAKGDRAVFTGLGRSGSRANLGLLNFRYGEVEVSVRLVDSAGATLSETTETLAGFELRQLDNIHTLGGRSGEALAVQVEVINEGRLTAYLSVIDVTSHDPVYQPAQVIRGDDSPACAPIPAIAEGTRALWTIGGDHDRTLETIFTDNITFDSVYRDVLEDWNWTIWDSETDLEIGITAEAPFISFIRGQSIKGTLFHAQPPSSPLDAEVSFYPGRVMGPSARWCEGLIWTIPAATKRTLRDGVLTEELLPAGNGVVQTVGEPLTVPGGSFTTARTETMLFGTPDNDRFQGPQAPRTFSWYDLETGVKVYERRRYDAENYDDHILESLDEN